MAVLLLKKGVTKKASTEVMSRFILSVWNDELKEHFSTEEQILSQHQQNQLLSLLIEQMFNEHEQIKEMINAVTSGSASAQLIRAFYQKLEQHIRFEERVLFPVIEKVLNNAALNAMGVQLSLLPQNSCVNFPVKFWE
ncbi:MAG: hemerythrin domain-containing protein [Chitinophagaceae bacterium]|nr:hemerythrin domain-containing protein [Chitinophagaceae bacterium]